MKRPQQVAPALEVCSLCVGHARIVTGSPRQADSVAIVAAIREPDTRHDFDGLPELRLRGLAEEDARTLLMSAVPGRIDDRVRDRIVAETRGNPLALLDLPRSMSAAELAGGFELLPALSHTPQAPPTASYGSSYVEPLTSGETRTTTLRLEPRAAEGSA